MWPAPALPSAVRKIPPFHIEAVKVRSVLAGAGIPMQSIETDYNDGKVGQIKNRVEAFLEMIKGCGPLIISIR